MKDEGSKNYYLSTFRLFNINAVHSKFFAFGNFDENTPTVWACKVNIRGMEGMLAVRAGHLAEDALKMKLCAFGDGVISKDVPIKLDRVIHDGCKFTDHQINTCDLFCSSFLRMAQGYIKNVLSYGKFMHNVRV